MLQREEEEEEGTVVKYGLEMPLTKRPEAEMKMLRFSLRVTKMDQIRNEYISETAQDDQFGDKVREARQRLFDTCKGGLVDMFDAENEAGQVRQKEEDHRGGSYILLIFSTSLPLQA